MTRVAMVGNFRPPFSTENDLRVAFEALGVDVAMVQEDGVGEWESLPQMVVDSDIDFVMWLKTWEGDVDMERRVLDRIRKGGRMVVGYHLDRWWGLEREEQIRRHPFFTHTDLLCTADGGHDAEWAALGVRHEWFPPAVSGRWVGLAEADHARFPHPVVFTGSWRQYHPEHAWRFQMVEALRERFRRTSTFGIYPVGGQRITGADLSVLYASADVVVGDSCLVSKGGRYWSDRIPETLGRGGILVHPLVDGGIIESVDPLAGALRPYTSGDVESLFDAVDAARAIRPENRYVARRAAVEMIANGHTYEHRMERLLGIVGAEDGQTRRRYWSMGEAATFLVRPESTDQGTCDETWVENVYRFRPEWVQDGLVVDIGANVGAVSVWAAKHGARRVLAFEPERGNFAALTANLEANHADVVLAVNVAISGGDALGWATMTGEGGGAKVERWSGRVEKGAAADVAARPFRWIFESMSGPVDLLKIDIEGGEWAILSSPENVAVIGERVRRMVVEFHNFGWDDGTQCPFGFVLAALAEIGKVEVLGRPSMGGLIWWEAYK